MTPEELRPHSTYVALRPVRVYGEMLEAPTAIQRLDSRHTHGWQARPADGAMKLFSDGMYHGDPRASLQAAIVYMAQYALPARARLHRTTMKRKRSGLPLGISDSIGWRKGRSEPEYALQVSLPRVGRPALNRKVHIGRVSTVTPAKVRKALERAQAIRDQGEREYRTQAQHLAAAWRARLATLVALPS